MRVLIIDDDADQREFLSQTVSAWGHQVRTGADGAQALDQLNSFHATVMLTDLKMPGMDGFELMQHLRSMGALPPTIVLTAFGSLENAVTTVHEYGGFWFLEKPVDTVALRTLLDRAADHGRLAADNERLRLELSHRGVLGDLVGESPQMRELFTLVRQIAGTNACVLITGESGTGKELVARAIHSSSPRSAEPFVAINCAAMPETLIESELFGHEKGAFTGAVERRAGALELAHGGTLLLDEIGEMPMAMQAKLLRVLEDFRYRRLGGKQELVANIRVLAATNRDPEDAVKSGHLREDLYYRLNVFHLALPPLRDRPGDIPMIAATLIERLNQKHATRVTHLMPDALAMLAEQRWEGNVRELRNVIERAVILAGSGPILRSHLALNPHRFTPAPAAANSNGGLQVHLGMTVADAERVLIEATLEHAQSNKTRAASVLGISTKTLHGKLKLYANTPSGATASSQSLVGPAVNGPAKGHAGK
jgi:DNA-binding NtrC family response regulator